VTGGLAATEPNTVLLPKYFKWLLVLMKRLSKVQSDKTVRRDNKTKQFSVLLTYHPQHLCLTAEPDVSCGDVT